MNETHLRGGPILMKEPELLRRLSEIGSAQLSFNQACCCESTAVIRLLSLVNQRHAFSR